MPLRLWPRFDRAASEPPASQPRSRKDERLATLRSLHAVRDARDNGADRDAAAVTVGSAPPPRRRPVPTSITPHPEVAELAPPSCDYILVGGGTAAATAAARMAEAGLKVLVLEAGVDESFANAEHRDPIEERVPCQHGVASESSRLTAGGDSYMVKHGAFGATDPNFDEEAGGIFYPRGAGFGGSSRVNAMFWVRPDDIDWEIIAEATGDPAWGPKAMRKVFQDIEHTEYRPFLRAMHRLGRWLHIRKLQNPQGLGMDGWLPITRGSPALLKRDAALRDIVTTIGKDALLRRGTLRDRIRRLLHLADPNVNATHQSAGVVLPPLTIDTKGRRRGPRDRLFNAKNATGDHITVRSGATVRKVLLDKDCQACGVTYVDQATDETHHIAARRGVIVAAGTFETPAVLMRSGIGDPRQLERHGIETKVESPGVGKQLSDREEYGVVFRLKEPLPTIEHLREPLKILNGVRTGDGDLAAEEIRLEEAAQRSPAIKKWLDGKGGILASNGAAIAFQAKSSASQPEPDLFFFLVPGDFHGYHRGYADEVLEDGTLMTLVILHENKGEGIGTVELNPADINGKPVIDFKYDEENSGGSDLPIVRAIEDIARPLIASLGDRVVEEVWPKPLESGVPFAVQVRRQVWGHHANHTAAIGDPTDPMTVVNGSLEVVGTSGLHVADASILDSPGSFPVSSVVAVGERMAQIAIDQTRRQGPTRRGL